MSPKITETELDAVKVKFRALVTDLIKAGLPNDKGLTANRKTLVYALKRIGAVDTSVVSNAQWAKFFRQTDELRFDFPGLAKYIGSLPVQANLFEQPVQPVQPADPVPAFSASDLEMLHDAGISVQDDSRQQVRYWKEKS